MHKCAVSSAHLHIWCNPSSCRASSPPGLLRLADGVLRTRGMEVSTGPQKPPPAQAEPEGPLKAQQNQTDSFLMAARLLRGGWLGEPGSPRCQFSNLVSSIEVLNPAEVWSRTSGTRRRASPSGDEGSEKQEAEQTPGGPISVKRQMDRAGRETGGVSIRAAACRMACRQRGRFKAPVLPAITEI